MTKRPKPQAQQVAAGILETAPVLMRTLRVQLRLASAEGLSVPQFHALLFLRRHPDAGLSEVADYVGATLPTMSELVNRLVAAGFVARTPNPVERRRVCLAVTTQGEALIDSTINAAREGLTDLFVDLDSERLSRLAAALTDLHGLLSPGSREGGRRDGRETGSEIGRERAGKDAGNDVAAEDVAGR